jgi:C-terminal processing protease CtpA/Prc
MTTPATRARVIDSTLRLLRTLYIDSAMAARMDLSVRARLHGGEYGKITDGNALATKLTDDLRAVSRDKHIIVNFDPEAAPSQPSGATVVSTEAAEAAELQYEKYENFGFRKVERLQGNVGYLNMSLFCNPKHAAPTAIAAMQLLANTDALIIDMRDNDGGSPNMVGLLTSYFIDSTAELTGIYTRADRRVHQSWVLPYVGVPKYVGKPVYILTSKDGTVSAAEGFTYNMKVLRRAVIVGDTSAGAANPGSERRIDAQFSVFVPTGRPVNPVTGTNWEGVGIAPDIRIPAARAFDTAYDAALQELLRTATDERKRTALRKIIEEQRARH